MGGYFFLIIRLLGLRILLVIEKTCHVVHVCDCAWTWVMEDTTWTHLRFHGKEKTVLYPATTMQETKQASLLFAHIFTRGHIWFDHARNKTSLPLLIYLHVGTFDLRRLTWPGTSGLYHASWSYYWQNISAKSDIYLD